MLCINIKIKVHTLIWHLNIGKVYLILCKFPEILLKNPEKIFQKSSISSGFGTLRPEYVWINI